MLLTKAASKTLFAEPPSTIGLSDTPSLVNVTLSLAPGAPAGDQFSPADQSVLPAVPLQAFCAIEAGFASTAPSTMRVGRMHLGFFMVGSWLGLGLGRERVLENWQVRREGIWIQHHGDTDSVRDSPETQSPPRRGA